MYQGRLGLGIEYFSHVHVLCLGQILNTFPMGCNIQNNNFKIGIMFLKYLTTLQFDVNHADFLLHISSRYRL